LETAINTELPGNIRAQVTEPVFSYDGKRILMPAGTVLIGTFNPDIMVAQKRVLIAWNRAITPKGQSIAIGSTGTDTLGRSGTAGNVDNRLGPKIGAAVLVTAINAVPSLLGGLLNKASPQQQNPSPVTVNVGGSGGSGGDAGGQLAQGAASAVAEQTSGFLEKYLSLPPIIRVPQGEEIRVFVNRDLVFR
jgi:type IV secretion system protein VirB10